MTTASLAQYPNVDDWIVIGADGRVRVRTGKVDIGQRISTALALIAAEELDVDLTRIDVDEVDTASSLDEEYTSASNSMERCGNSVRLAAATARRELLDLAARELGVEVDTLEVTDGEVRSHATSSTVTYAALMRDRKFGVPVDTGIATKPPERYHVLGRAVQALDLAQLVAGAAPFVQDLRLPDMRYARLVRPPHPHARVESIDPSVEDRLGGARLVRNGSFLAVVADREYDAIRAAARLAGAVRWRALRKLDATNVHTLLRTSPAISLPVVDGEAVETPVPPLEPPPADAAITVHTRLTRPYLMHGSIGPSAAIAQYDGRDLTIVTHTQGVFPLRLTIAESLGLDPAHVRLVQRRGPGCYGHNGADDAALDAGLIAMAMPGPPIHLQWSREGEHAWEPYGPAMVVEVRASVDADGRIVDWNHETWSDTHRTRPRPGPGQIGPARMLATRFLPEPPTPFVVQPFLSVPLAGVHRNAEPGYNFKRRRIVKHLVRDMPLRTSTLRSLGAYANVMAIETTMDSLAREAGIDPLAFRLSHLDDPRAKAVLQAAADRAQWGKRTTPPGHGRGLAYARYINKKAYAAVIADVEVDDAANVRVHRLTIAADAGQIVDREGLALQVEGGALQSLSFTLYEAVRYDENGILTRDWESYPMLRFDRAPDVDVVLLDRPGEPYLGPSECSVGPTAAAISNAIFDATGLRLVDLPFDADALRSAALRT
ncbi:MAG: molybdopterin cofactor-binding domain-containing protein [Burkholderiales bacterium]